MKRGMVFWFTGLSGAGKTTLAEKVCERLKTLNIKAAILDGDDVRTRLHRHLGFTEDEIKENNALIAGLCEKERVQSDVVLVPIISPYAQSRARAQEQLSPGFFEVHIHADISVLEERDTKGMYAKARNGEMNNLIGVSPSAPYEPPVSADLVLDTSATTFDETLDTFCDFIIAQTRKWAIEGDKDTV